MKGYKAVDFTYDDVGTKAVAIPTKIDKMTDCPLMEVGGYNEHRIL